MKKYSNLEDMLSEIDPEFGASFRKYMQKPSVKIKMWFDVKLAVIKSWFVREVCD